MSVVAWDGKSLAADKMAVCGDLAASITKVALLANGKVAAWTGDACYGQSLAHWYEDGANPDKWPAAQSTDDWARLIIADADGVMFYERSPYPIKVEDDFAAWGSGRDFAIGAMAMGATAKVAVEVASKHCISCGMGSDVFYIDGLPR